MKIIKELSQWFYAELPKNKAVKVVCESMIEKVKDDLWFEFMLRGRAIVGEIECRIINDTYTAGNFYCIYARGVYVGKAIARKMYRDKTTI